MVIVIGVPVARRVGGGVGAGGLAVAIGAAVVEAGGTAQLVGTVGDDKGGDAVVLSVAEMGIGHAALLRRPGPVPVEDPDDRIDLEGSVDRLAEIEADAADAPGAAHGERTPTLDAADVALALRYLPDERVVVAADPLSADTLAAVVEAARWAEARLIVVTAAGSQTPGLPDDATVLEAPAEDAEGAFATLVGRYAAALDRGEAPAEAFAAASADAGWLAVEA